MWQLWKDNASTVTKMSQYGKIVDISFFVRTESCPCTRMVYVLVLVIKPNSDHTPFTQSLYALPILFLPFFFVFNLHSIFTLHCCEQLSTKRISFFL